MYEYRVVDILKIVDGDTVDVTVDVGFSIMTKQRVRLYGINAPESRTRNLDEKKRGLAAKARLTEVLNNAKEIIVQTKLDKKGKYGRLLGTFIADGINVNELLVKEGHATEYVGGKR